jgi:hypothetical protein
MAAGVVILRVVSVRAPMVALKAPTYTESTSASRFPVIVTTWFLPTIAGVKLIIFGTGTKSTRNSVIEEVTELGLTKRILPVVAPTGMVTLISVLVLEIMVASLIVKETLVTSAKPVPVMTTVWPGCPLAGEKVNGVSNTTGSMLNGALSSQPETNTAITSSTMRPGNVIFLYVLIFFRFVSQE